MRWPGPGAVTRPSMLASCSVPPAASGGTRLNSMAEAAIIRREPVATNRARKPATTQSVRVKASEGRRGRHVIPRERRARARSFLQYLVDERDRRGSLPHRGGHALLVPAADIAHGEDAGKARLQEVRRPRQRPLRRPQVVPREVGPGLDKPLLVAHDAAVEPA